MKYISKIEVILTAVLAAVALASCFDLLRAIHLGNAVHILTVLILDSVFVLTAVAARQGRMPWLLVLTSVTAIVCFVNMNFSTYELQQPGLLVIIAANVIGAVAGTTLAVLGHVKPVRIPVLSLSLIGIILIVFLGSYVVKLTGARSAAGFPKHELWGVPKEYDAPGCEQAGTVEELVYQTKAYATDERAVEKRAMVYLPYGYDETKEYDILYLMHGTGDDENYWLITNPSNKDMLDRLIASGSIRPVIVVTPTFYVEDDGADGLDVLTFSFKEELRCDLMPAVESRYSTYAASIDDAGFAASREHRSFAGLSRGSVTTAHSALCGSLDYFSKFGLFSAFRTTQEYMEETMRGEEFGDLSIDYLYMTSGNFDFALLPQIRGYEMMLETEPRLVHGVNCDFDVFPMRYHQIGNWHLALYNFLQRAYGASVGE